MQEEDEHMLTWFEKQAPIRSKFAIIVTMQSGLCALAFAATLWAVAGGNGAVALVVAGLAVALVVITGLITRTIVCNPYVEMAARIEAIVGGDLDAHIPYTDFTDCVGRMARAMTSFRESATVARTATQTQEMVVTELSRALEQLARNDLTCRIDRALPGSYAKIQQNFNTAVEGLGQAIGAVTGAASGIAIGSGQIRSASDDLAARTEQQAVALAETTAAMNRVTAMVQDNARNAANVTVSMTDAHKEATDGGRIVSEAVEAMGAIQKSSQEITQIINVIDSIAFQTNLLALNAGVEAARAGDAGRGFAVVANEVRALAQRSADAAKEIKDLITKSTVQVNMGVSLVGDTGKALTEIVSRVGDVTSVISQISKVAEQQAVDLERVNSTVGDMDKMTQQNAAMVEESTAAARSLAGEAEQLSRLVADFRVSGSGTGDFATASSAAPRAVAARTAAPRTVAPRTAPRPVPRLPEAAPPRPAPAPARTASVAPRTSGALAIKADFQTDDWSEF